ncbi:MAG: FtsX-like permease family protein, partial [Rhodospirillales bacterium]|nr:FtsX-like permease family protein [Rhodospirillales bacterium]
VYVPLAQQQSMQGRPRVVNEIHLKLADITRSIPTAAAIEGRFGFKTAPWEETYARVLSVFRLQNLVTYGATGSILLVAGFGIFNIISTVVLEKARDIAIMRSIGLAARDIVAVFLVEGLVVGVLGVLAGSGVGFGLATLMRQMPSPGATDPSQRLLVVQSVPLYGLAAGLALATALAAAWLPSRRAAQTDPLDVIRGAT